MVGFLQIIIWLFCIYLVFKGVEIFQIAYVSPDSRKRSNGVAVGVIFVVIAACVALGAFWLTESMAKQMADSFSQLPK